MPSLSAPTTGESRITAATRKLARNRNEIRIFLAPRVFFSTLLFLSFCSPDMACLGPEEEAHHASLLGVEQEVRSIVSALNGSGQQLKDHKAVERRLQHCMSDLRAHIRDLELLAEEQDT
jgi:hypothetical protein